MMFRCHQVFQIRSYRLYDGYDNNTDILSVLVSSSPALARYAADSVHNKLLQRWAVSITLLRFYDSPSQCLQVNQSEQVKDSNSRDLSAETTESPPAEVLESDATAEVTTAQKLQPFVQTR
jgi:hypothetical protein